LVLLFFFIQVFHHVEEVNWIKMIGEIPMEAYTMKKHMDYLIDTRGGGYWI